MQAIVTKYLPATNYRGSRVKASCDRGGSGYHMVEIGENDPNNTTAMALVTSPGGSPLSEAEANARLIAAAPELLAALELAVATIERLAVKHGPFNSAQGTLDVAMQAIAKAKGEAP